MSTSKREMDKQVEEKCVFDLFLDDDYFDEDEAIEADFFYEVENG